MPISFRHWLSALIVLTCMLPHIASAKVKKQPCWLQDVQTTEHPSIYGIAKTVTGSHLPPLHFAKRNAINNWAVANGFETINPKQDLSELTSYELAGQVLHFVDSYKTKGKIYSLVSTTPMPKYKARQCKVQKCDISRCSPKWLCEQDNEWVTIYGISATTGHPNEVIQHMLKNAQQLARTVNLADVKGVTRQYNYDNNDQSVSQIQQSFDIKVLDNQVSQVKMTNMCQLGSTTISQVVFPKNDIGREHDWMLEPNVGDWTGAVGYAKGATATGRLSDLTEFAVRRGLFELAKQKNISLYSDLELKISDAGYYSLVRRSEQKTEALVSAFVADMKMELNRFRQPEVFIWLLENKGEL